MVGGEERHVRQHLVARAPVVRVVAPVVGRKHIVDGLEEIDAQSLDAPVKRTIELHPHHLRIDEAALAVLSVMNHLRVEVEDAFDRK